MRLFSATVFDDLITGTATWYSSSETYDLLGQADYLSFQFCPRGIGGTGTTLSASTEHSPDGQIWLGESALLFNPQFIFNETPAYGAANQQFPRLHFVRLNLNLGGGTGAKCFLKVYATGRVRAL